ncbi:MAG: MerR family transcriptional regulator [Anaerolineae bacterium]|nr:MerR family transcriptional regulator [Anaerolineae bacterium]
MADTYRIPLFKPKAVSQETGVKADVLRAWERRYGLPQPARSPGGHRLYSQRDIDTIKWLVARQREGLSIKQAVELWRGLEARGQEPLQKLPPAPPVALPAGDILAEMRQAWVSACLSFDESLAEQTLAQAFALYPPETVCLQLLQKGLAQIGEGWYAGQVTVHQEHFASALALRRVGSLVLHAPPPTRPGRIITACPPREAHTFSLLLFTYLLRRRGWEVLYLGADVPWQQMKAAIAHIKPRLVILAAQRLSTAATLLEMAHSLQEEHLLPSFGGGIFNRLPALRTRIPGHFLGATLEQAVPVVEELMTTHRPPPALTPVAPDHLEALAYYRDRRTEIENRVWETLRSQGVAPDSFLELNEQFAPALTAALALGDIAFLDNQWQWLKGLGQSDRIPTTLLYAYLHAYQQATQALLDERDALLVRWMVQQLDTA